MPLSLRAHRAAVAASVILGIAAVVAFYQTAMHGTLRMDRCDAFSVTAADPYCRVAKYWFYAWLALTVAAIAVGIIARVRRPRR
jgi:hypothetical protein